MAAGTGGRRAAFWLGLVVLLVLVSQCSRPGSQRQATAGPEAGLRGACIEFLKRRLHDPGSADFGDASTWSVVGNTDGTWSVGARYRARIPAGGLRQASATCVLRRNGGNIELEKLTEL